MAPFTDAARAVDQTNFATTFISYYTYGAAIALALDLSLRDRSNGKLSLDDYMRAMWRVHGKPAARSPGLVAKPYTLTDARDRLAEVSGDRAFADEFFDKYVEGRDVADYARLVRCAPGCVLRKRNAGAAWTGRSIRAADEAVAARSQRPDGVRGCDPGSLRRRRPAGLDQGDVIIDVDGKAIAAPSVLQAAVKRAQAGRSPDRSRSRGAAARPDGDDHAEGRSDARGRDGRIDGGTLTADQKAFRDGWLGSKIQPESLSPDSSSRRSSDPCSIIRIPSLPDSDRMRTGSTIRNRDQGFLIVLSW